MIENHKVVLITHHALHTMYINLCTVRTKSSAPYRCQMGDLVENLELAFAETESKAKMRVTSRFNCAVYTFALTAAFVHIQIKKIATHL